MNPAQQDYLNGINAVINAVGSAKAFVNTTMSPIYSAHPCPQFQADIQAVLDAIDNCAPLQAALVKLQTDAAYIPIVGAIS